MCIRSSLAVLAAVALIVGCSSDKTSNPPPNQGNRPPTHPGNPSPADGAAEQDSVVALQWTCSDPDGDSVFFDVYFGESSNPSGIASNLTVNSIEIPALQYNKTYYWRVTATDRNHIHVQSPTWRFSTMQKTPMFVDPSPPDNGRGVARRDRFNWEFLFGPSASVVFDVHYGRPGDISGRIPDLSEPRAVLGNFEYGTAYQWYVVARQASDTITIGPTWEFTVREELTQRGRFVTTPRFPWLIALEGDRLYIGTLPLPYWDVGSLYVFDITNHDAPAILGATTVPGGYLQDLAVFGSTAYVLQSGIGLSTFDVSNPVSPHYLATYDYDSEAYYGSVAVSGDYAYISAIVNTHDAILLTIDVSSPSSPQLASVLGEIYGKVAISGSFGYAYSNGRLAVLDLSDPSAPGLMISTDFASGAPTLFAAYPLLFSGYMLYSIENPAVPVKVGELPTNHNGTHPDASVCWSNGDLAEAEVTYSTLTYVALIDITDPANPLIVKEFNFDCLLGVASNGSTIVATARERPCQINVSSGEIQIFDM